MTPDFEARLRKAIDDGILPGTVLLARDKSGKINYTFSHGPATLDPALASSPPPPITPSTLFALASMTKLLTAIAALQLVDRGLVTLDSDLAPHLPALAAQPVLLLPAAADPSSSSSSSSSPTSGGGGGDDDAVPPPQLRPRTQPLRLRHLLTHSSGAGYPFLSPALEAYFASAGRPIPLPLSPVGGRTVEERFAYPLLFEPGGGWAYGCGLDWAGRLVEALTGRGLDDYLWENVLSRVGVERRSGVTFYPGRYVQEGQEGRRVVVAGMTGRDEATGKVVHFPMGRLPGASGAEEEEERAALGGEGAYAAMDEYIKVLYSLLVDDGKLLRPETARFLFEPLLREPEAKQALLESVKHPEWIVGWVPDTGGEYDWSPGGLLVDGDSHPYRKRGFLQWGGVFNLSWFVDREAGVCGIYATQVAKPADPVLRPFMKEFEEIIYSRL